jgi:hypothetical protein
VAATGSYGIGFVLLALFAVGCLLVNLLYVKRKRTAAAVAATEGRVR